MSVPSTQQTTPTTSTDGDECLENRPEEMNLLSLPTEIIYKIFKQLPFQVVAKQRLVCRTFKKIGCDILNSEFHVLRNRTQELFQSLRNQMPRRESARRKHTLSREYEIVETMNMRLTLLQMTFTKHILREHCCFFPGEILDEVHRILLFLRRTSVVNRNFRITDELFDLSSMAMEYFKESIEPLLPDANLMVDYDSYGGCGASSSNSGASSATTPTLPAILSGMMPPPPPPPLPASSSHQQQDAFKQLPFRAMEESYNRSKKEGLQYHPGSLSGHHGSPYPPYTSGLAQPPPIAAFPFAACQPMPLPPNSMQWDLNLRLQELEKAHKALGKSMESVKSSCEANNRKHGNVQKASNRHQALLNAQDVKVRQLEEDYKNLKAEFVECNTMLSQTRIELEQLKSALLSNGNTTTTRMAVNGKQVKPVRQFKSDSSTPKRPSKLVQKCASVKQQVTMGSKSSKMAPNKKKTLPSVTTAKKPRSYKRSASEEEKQIEVVVTDQPRPKRMRTKPVKYGCE